jgi:hypothetical protein
MKPLTHTFNRLESRSWWNRYIKPTTLPFLSPRGVQGHGIDVQGTRHSLTLLVVPRTMRYNLYYGISTLHARMSFELHCYFQGMMTTALVRTTMTWRVSRAARKIKVKSHPFFFSRRCVCMIPLLLSLSGYHPTYLPVY